MRRGPIILMTLLPFTMAASAQTPGPVERNPPIFFASATAVTPPSPDVVVARVMSFDRDNDGRVTKEELPDRMHNLLPDANGGALDSNAVRARAMTAVAATTATTTGRGFQGSGGYTFGDQISLSTRAHVEGALDDLRLPVVTREQALAIVTPFMETLEADATAALVADLHFMLTVAQLTDFKATLERQLSGRGGVVSGVNRVVRPDGTRVEVFMKGMDLAQRINGYRLPAEQTRRALDALEGFKERIRPGKAERSKLLEQLQDVLNDEERDNFRAALERRPLVKSGFPAMMAGVVSGVVGAENRVVPDGAIGNALFIMPKTASPAPRVLEP